MIAAVASHVYEQGKLQDPPRRDLARECRPLELPPLLIWPVLFGDLWPKPKAKK